MQLKTVARDLFHCIRLAMTALARCGTNQQNSNNLCSECSISNWIGLGDHPTWPHPPHAIVGRIDVFNCCLARMLILWTINFMRQQYTASGCGCRRRRSGDFHLPIEMELLITNCVMGRTVEIISKIKMISFQTTRSGTVSTAQHSLGQPIDYRFLHELITTLADWIKQMNCIAVRIIGIFA